ncbi:unnamed protein product [Ilex paraguariensis]|uniref:Putative plant transposon protein domain-containing protein n=1 Tax=Ilex paraguariensis TaxID=185542 RepID=A0ABC8TJC8_9AQUA
MKRKKSYNDPPSGPSSKKKCDLKFKSLVRKVSFEVTPDLVSKILGVRRPFAHNNTLTYPFNNSKYIPKLEDVYTEMEGIPNNFSESVADPLFFQQHLTLKYMMLNLIVGYNIRPIGHNVDFGLDQVHLLYAIGTSMWIDIPCLIIDEFISVHSRKDRRKCLPFLILISKIMEDCGVVIHSSDAYSTPMNPIYSGTTKKSLGKGKNKKTQPQQSLGKGKNKKTRPQVEIQNDVAPEDNIAAQEVPNSSTGGLPPLDDRFSLFGALLARMGRKMEEFENTQNEIKESLKVIDSRLDRIDSRWDRIESFFMKSKEIASK